MPPGGSGRLPPDADLVGSVLIRGTRLVPIRTAAPGSPVDVRIERGIVTRVAGALPAGRGEQVVEADGRWLIPGLWDKHVHMTQWSQLRRRLDLGSTRCAEDALRVVSEHVAALPADGRAVIGYGHRLALWPRRPTVAELDAVSRDHPVVLISGDAHNGWLNSRALRLLGVAEAADGPIEEQDWFGLYAHLESLPGVADADGSAHREAAQAASARGVVGVVDFEFGEHWSAWPRRVADGVDRLRVRTAVYPDRFDDVVSAGHRTGDRLPGGRGLVEMGPLKIISDGSLNTRTAFCHEPYADAVSAERGRPNYLPEELVDLLRRARAHGLAAAVHAIGDAAVGAALDAFEATGAHGSIEHAQLVADPDVVRMAALHVVASVQPAHLLDDRDVTHRCWPDRADRCFRLRSLLDSGVRLELGSDAPVAPLDPWLAMAAAVHRSADDRPAWNPAESLTPRAALAASTDGLDTVAAGTRGDVVLLDEDPLREGDDPRATADRLRSMSVAATYVGGRPAFLAL